MIIDHNLLSPMMRHYFEIKNQYSDCIILYRLGDFYEMFFDDAILASKVLDITLTGRECGLSERAPMCGVPHHAVDSYIAKLINKKYKVAICEQLTKPSDQKGMVERDIVRVITPGTVVEENILKASENNYILSIFAQDDAFSMSWCDLSTGEFNTYESEISNQKILDLLSSISPAEIICNEGAFRLLSDIKKSGSPINYNFQKFNEYSYKTDVAREKIKNVFKIKSLDIFEISDKKFAIASSGALIEYLLSTQKKDLPTLVNIKLVRDNSFMFLDSSTKQNLELIETIKDKKTKGSLLYVLDKTKTAMGARLLKKWINQPLVDENLINQRLAAVDGFYHDIEKANEIREDLSKIQDLERLISRIAYAKASPRDILGIKNTLKQIPDIKAKIEKFSKSKLVLELNSNLEDFVDLTNYLQSAIKEDAPALVKDGGYIREGFSQKLDELRKLKDTAFDWLLEFENRQKEETGIKNLKVSYNKIFGYFIEVSKGSVDKIPMNYVRKQTLTNSERYTNEELSKKESEILSSQDDAILLENELYKEILVKLNDNVRSLLVSSHMLATLDVLLNFAYISHMNRYVKPVVSSKINHIKIVNGRHPVVESLIAKNSFIENDAYLDNNENNIIIVTGPNMSGKSTYMRQIAIIVLMSQIGCFIPADMGEISLTDRIFTRIGASDDLSSGLSTFMSEMIEAALIMKNATKRSLIIVDELGRGTSTYDGLSIAWAFVEHVANKLKAKTLFSTHYHELLELENLLPAVKNYCILVREIDGNIVFLHKIARGGTDKSFGIDVALLAGMPKEMIDRARNIAKLLSYNDLNRDSNLIVLHDQKKLDKKNTTQLSMFDDKRKENAINKIKKIDINNLTPLDAFNVLREIKGDLDD